MFNEIEETNMPLRLLVDVFRLAASSGIDEGPLVPLEARARTLSACWVFVSCDMLASWFMNVEFMVGKSRSLASVVQLLGRVQMLSYTSIVYTRRIRRLLR
jgi:hypothetical protein